jgi:homoserine O-acetyltransferase/O-succinyltransferase
LAGVLGTGIASHTSVPTAIVCFLTYPNSLPQAIKAAIGLGGDTDTIAAMTGALAGAHLGLAAVLSRGSASRDTTPSSTSPTGSTPTALLSDPLATALSRMDLLDPSDPVTETRISLPSVNNRREDELCVQIVGEIQPGRGNVILVAPDFHLGHRTGGADGWWSQMIGPGRTFDTNHYAVVSPGYLGTSPVSPSEIGMADLADNLGGVLDVLEVSTVEVVVGGGSGGLAALTFAVRHPDRVRRLVSIASGARVTTLQSMHLAHQIGAIDLAGSDPQRLELAWRIATVRRRSLAALEHSAASAAVEDIDRYLTEASRRYWQSTSPDHLKTLLWAWRRFDLAVAADSPDPVAALAKLNAIKTLVIGIDSDSLFYPQEQAHLTQLLAQAGVGARRFTMHSDHGHDGWIHDAPVFAPLIDELLAT